jgi:hypothetical protein
MTRTTRTSRRSATLQRTTFHRRSVRTNKKSPCSSPAAAERRPEQIIELDCPPGDPRPGDLIVGALVGTGLDVRPDVQRFFGCWRWDYSDVPAETWDRIRPILGCNIKALYDQELTRYDRR